MVVLNYKEKRIINGYEDDPLWFEWFLSVGIFKYKIIRLTLALNIMFCILKYVFQIYLFKNKLSYFVRYGLLFFAEPYAVAAEATILWKAEEMEDCFNSLPWWKYDSCGEKLERKLGGHMKINKIAVTTVLISFVVVSCITFYPSSRDKKYMFPVFFIEENFPNQAWFLSLAYKSTLLPMGYCAMVHPLLVMYGAMHIMCQTEMLAEHFKQVTLIGFEDKDKDSFISNQEIQEEIRNRIVFCIKRHIDEIRYAERSLKLVQELFGILVLFWYSAGFGVLMFYFSFKLGYIEHNLGDMLFSGLTCFNGIAMFIGLVICGQNTEDASAMILAAVKQWDWWALDVRSRKIMLVILSGTKEFKMQFSQNFVINYNLAVNMTKTIYSLTSLIATVEQFQ